ncbi:MAG: hypothetical protein FK734_15540 [Asgard group archaeon]|nr:hypothetical protein [Asgard group archaeon]
MSSNKIINVLTWILIVSGLGLAGWGLYKLGFGASSEYAVLILVMGLVVFLIGAVLFFLKGRLGEKKQTTPRRYTPVSQPNLSSLDDMNSIRDKPIHKDRIIKARRVIHPPPGEVCMISKMELTPDDEILQCTFCGSYFIKSYLEDWLAENKNCPVCQSILVEEI